MKNKLCKALFLGVCLFGGTVVSAQKSKELRGDKSFDYYEYINVIEVFEKIVAKGYLNVNVLSKLADAYYFKGDFDQAKENYARLFAFAEQEKIQLPSEYYYRYSQSLRAVKDYVLADKYMETFVAREQSESRAILFQEQQDHYVEAYFNGVKKYEVQPISINSEYSDFGAAFLEDNFVYTSARHTTESSKTNKWNGEATTHIYQAKVTEEGVFEEPKLWEKISSSKVNDASAVFNKEGTVMYFTRNNFEKGRKVHNKDLSILLKIYQAKKLADGSWGEIKELPFNSDDFNTAHPALSLDENWLYFSSDRPGSKGYGDLYRVAILEEGTFGEPENLGDRINTEGRETFPFISPDNYLYFSSDGRPGLGGLDVYRAKINADNSFERVMNVPAPINSPRDDFAFYVGKDNKKGFVSSNRIEGTGADDIYFFQVVDCKQKIETYVYDSSTQLPIENAKVTLLDAMYQTIGEIAMDSLGKGSSDLLDCNQRVRIQVQADGFLTKEMFAVIGRDFDGVYKVNIGLDPIVEKIGEDDDLFKKLKLDPIYFDFDKATIRPDAKVELAKVVEALLQFDRMKIDIRSHTDSRGPDAYNLKLSDRRAKATRDWIVEQGIAPERVTAKGYGETELINDCKNGVPCSKEKHQENRRSEFIILAIE